MHYVPPISAIQKPDELPPITEPPQNIDYWNSREFRDESQDETPDDIDRDVKKIEQDLNALDAETTSHPKNTKKHKNTATISVISRVALIMSAILPMSFNCAR